MYTRCPHCSTIFRVTAAQLRVAVGEVSCGSCHTTFNALNALSDDLPELTEAVVLDPIDAPVADEPSHDEQAENQPAGDGFVTSGHDDAGEEFEAVVLDAADSDDSLIDTVVDEPVETELSAEETEEPADPPEAVPPADDDNQLATADDQGESEGDDEVEEPADAAVETAAETPAEPLYDDDTGYEEVLTVVGWDEDEDGEEAPHEDNTADTWASILTDVDDPDRREERRELEEAARTTHDDTATHREPVEPAYDDNTGIEEVLAAGEFNTAEDGDDPAEAPEHDDALEFNAPEQAWSEIFVPTDARSPLAMAPEIEGGAEPEEPLDLSPLSPLESETADPDEWAGFLSELTPGEVAATEFAPGPENGDEGPVVVLGSEDEVAVSVGSPDAAAIEADPLIDYEPEFVPPWESEPPEDDAAEAAWKRPSNRHIAIAAALVLALGMQLIHYNRDSIATHPSWGNPLRAFYGAFGQELYPDWDLAAYRISGSEAVAGRTAPTVLDILANVVISGNHEVGMPLIRVALRDRWSNTVASRIFSPREYLRDFDTRPALVSPGTTLPVEISVADPGAEAHGYVVDICLPRRTSGLQCQNAIDPFQQQ